MVTTEKVMEAINNSKNTPKFDLSLIEDYPSYPYIKPSAEQERRIKEIQDYFKKLREEHNVKIQIN